MKLDRIATTFHLNLNLGSTVFSAYDKRLNYFFYGNDVCFIAQNLVLNFWAMRALPQHLDCRVPKSDCVAEILIVNFEFKASSTIVLLLTN